ncbi:MAG TPA: hypothetical protein VK694_03190 [Verrucomicrobiae bacterium]|nr:hypothetical protein [Verrucomicrobiae bacterium]
MKEGVKNFLRTLYNTLRTMLDSTQTEGTSDPEPRPNIPVYRGARCCISIDVFDGDEELTRRAEAFLAALATHDLALVNYIDHFPGGIRVFIRPFPGEHDLVVKYYKRGNCLDRRAATYLTILVEEFFRADNVDGLAIELSKTSSIPAHIR